VQCSSRLQWVRRMPKAAPTCAAGVARAQTTTGARATPASPWLTAREVRLPWLQCGMRFASPRRVLPYPLEHHLDYSSVHLNEERPQCRAPMVQWCVRRGPPGRARALRWLMCTPLWSARMGAPATTRREAACVFRATQAQHVGKVSRGWSHWSVCIWRVALPPQQFGLLLLCSACATLTPRTTVSVMCMTHFIPCSGMQRQLQWAWRLHHHSGHVAAGARHLGPEPARERVGRDVHQLGGHGPVRVQLLRWVHGQQLRAR
jgi:hypothetical protein